MEKQLRFRVALLDADFILYSATYDKDGNEKPFEKVIQDADNMILNLFNMTEATHYIGAFTIGRSFRYEVYPEYKANRKDKVKPKYFKALREYLIDKWGFIYHRSLEADDIVNICYHGYFHKAVMEDYGIYGYPIRISTDKDVLNLDGFNFDAKNLKQIEINSNQAIIYFWGSMITGDNTDNIKGVEGMGIKAVEKLLVKNKENYISLKNNVLDCYINKYGEQKGIELFYSNYKCLKILENYEGFNIPEPIKIEYNIVEN